MSLHLHLNKTCDHCGHTEEYWCGNITHNLTEMASQACLYRILWRPEEIDVHTAGRMIGTLEEGIKELEMYPNAFKVYNPDNGWGSYEGLLEFAKDCLTHCYKHPDASVVACR